MGDMMKAPRLELGFSDDGKKGGSNKRHCAKPHIFACNSQDLILVWPRCRGQVCKG